MTQVNVVSHGKSQTLRMDAPRQRLPLRLPKIAPRYWVPVLAVAVLVVAALIYLRLHNAGLAGTEYALARAHYGDVVQTVSANGTVNPVVEVNVGSQVSGTVQKLYVDFNSRVRKGQVLLQLDPTLLRAQVAQSEASLHNAQANLLLAQVNAQRVTQLQKSGYASGSDLDQATANLKVATAQVELAAAQLQRDTTNLQNTIIKSPVDGVVINREVDVGQTVAASFQTPTLFIIGQNLKNMQIDVTVDEADVGQIRTGEAVNFTVDAYPDRKYAGKVTQIRLNPTIVQNVVTYDVVVSVDNEDESLLPGMTAYVNIVVQEHHHVLLVPNTALRVRIPGVEAQSPAAGAAGVSSGTVYVLENGKLQRIPVSVGPSDGNQTEITGGKLRDGDSVVVGFVNSTQAKKRNPFQLF